MADVVDPTSSYELPDTHQDPGPINPEQKLIVGETNFFPFPVIKHVKTTTDGQKNS